MNQPIKNPTQRGNADGVINVFQSDYQHQNFNPVELIVQRLEGVKSEGKGYRALCPACGGQSRKLTIVEGDDGRALINCFGCRDTRAVLDAIGLKWADVFPFRAWPESPEDKRKASQAMRQTGWRSALGVLDYEATLVCIASGQMLSGEPLSNEDHDRLLLASNRIASTREVLR
jgi:hypothetical protein